MQGPVVPGGRRRQGFRPLPVIAVCPSLPARHAAAGKTQRGHTARRRHARILMTGAFPA